MNAKRFLVAVAACGLAAGVVLTAASQTRPDVLVKQRQAAMVLQGKYFGPLAGMLRGTQPYDGEVVARNARYLEALSAMPWDGFSESTKGETSRALPALWTEYVKFQREADQLQAAIAALVTASRGGNEQDAKAAIENVGKVCGSCHDDFRSK